MNPQQWTNLIWIIAVLVDLAIKIAALIIIPRDRKPTAAMAWLLAIFLIPYVGIIFFLVLGSTRLPRKRLARQKEIDGMITAAVAGKELTPRSATWPKSFASIVRMNQQLTAVPIVDGNTAVLIDDYQAGIAAMAAEIRAAQHFVHVEFFIVSWDDTTRDFFLAMEETIKRGVVVRVLLDHISSWKAVDHKKTFAELDRIGAIWAFMLPFQPLKGKIQRPDLRNHRKLVVVDGRVGFMGSQNLIDRSYNTPKNLKRGLQWQELMTRIEGPVVSSINGIFLSDWYSETAEQILEEHVKYEDVPSSTSPDALEAQLVPSGPGYDNENNVRMFLALIHSAQEKVMITSPYFVPNEAMMYAITSACQRGLEVHLYVSEIGDQAPVFHAQRSYYSELLKAGVRIFGYPAPYILHAKHFSIDDDIAVIGSSNMDIRSFNLDLEISLMVRGKSFVDQMRAVEAHYREISKEITPEAWANEPARAKTFDGLARLTSALE